MRTLPLVPILALLVLAPAAQAAPLTYVQSTNTYSVSTGDELVAAVTQAKSTGTAQNPATIDLDYSTNGTDSQGQPVPHPYVITSPIQLSSSDHVVIQSAAAELAPTASGYADAWTTLPNIYRTDYGPVLDITGSGNTVRGIEVVAPDSLTEPSGSAAASLVSIAGGATLGTTDPSSLAQVSIQSQSSSAPDLTALSLSGAGSVAGHASIVSGATAPAIALAGSATLRGGVVYGAGPALDVSAAGTTTAAPALIDGPRLISAAASAVHVSGAGSTGGSVQIRNTRIQGVAPNPSLSQAGSTLVSIDGSQGLSVGLTTSSLQAGATGVVVTPGAETSATQVTLLGVLAWDDGTGNGAGPIAGVTCSGSPATRAQLDIKDSDLSGATSVGSACTQNQADAATNLNVDPHLDLTTYAPTWDSPIVNKVPATGTGTLDFDGHPRASLATGATSATPVDIGASEYQYAAPTFSSATQTAIDHLGTVLFTATATDNDDVTDPNSGSVTPASTITWTFPDGSHQTGLTATYVFPATGSRTVTITATDGTGMSTTTKVIATPDRSAVVATPTPTPTPTPTDTPAPTPTPAPVATGAGTTNPTPTPAPSGGSAGSTQSTTTSTRVVAKFALVSSRISKSNKKASGAGTPGAGDAALLLTLNQNATLTMVARTQKGTKYGAISGARFSVVAKPGVVNIRLSAAFGKAKLKAGLYRITMLVTGPTGAADAADREDFSLRVK